MSQTDDSKKQEEKKKEEEKMENPVCTNASVAEHSRFDQEGEPCDDGRAG